MEESRYYYFEDYGVARYDAPGWYWRDRKNHKWIYDFSYDRRFIDAQYTVIQIDYDEETETIKPCKGRVYCEWEKELLRNISCDPEAEQEKKAAFHEVKKRR